MRVKSWLKYLVYSVLIFLLIFLRENVVNEIEVYSKTRSPSKIIINIINILNVVVVGVLIGLEQFICEVKKDGRWKINLSKFILVGLPSLYLSFSTVLIFTGSIISYPVLWIWQHGYSSYMPLFQLISGHVIITSFSKISNDI